MKTVLLRDENWPTPMIAQALRIHETTIVRYIDNYVRDEKLTCDSGGS
ncbi:MAG: helix-turn-helix domain-containing protein [Gammaproteobacteria bacterium]|nr:helix-turn-helix domain-containing protein [Gammaproteobacteria bacterium]